MKYITKEDFDRGDFTNIIEANSTSELLEHFENVKGYGIEPSPDERVDGIVHIRHF